MSNHTISILGCGWLGKQLAVSLLQSGYVVLGSTTRKENVSGLKSAGIVPFVFHVREVPDEARTFFESDILIISLPQGSRAGRVGEYVDNIRHVTRAAKEGKIRHIILFSTTSVYPNLNRVVTEEDADQDNLIVHAEKIVIDSGISTTILRFAGLFGPGRHPGRFLAGKRDLTGGNSPVNMVHLDDCVEVIKRVIEKNIWNEVLNVCADEHPTRKEFYTKAASALGLEVPLFLDDDKVHYKIVSNDKLKRVLAYKFFTSIDLVFLKV